MGSLRFLLRGLRCSLLCRKEEEKNNMEEEKGRTSKKGEQKRGYSLLVGMQLEKTDGKKGSQLRSCPSKAQLDATNARVAELETVPALNGWLRIAKTFWIPRSVGLRY